MLVSVISFDNTKGALDGNSAKNITLYHSFGSIMV